jgi:uncharacterized protein
MADVKKRDVILAGLAPGGVASYTPVQIQKLLFLLDQEISAELGGPHFRFRAYHYGPFDRGIYDVLENLESSGEVQIDRNESLRIRTFRLTQKGVEAGLRVLNNVSPVAKDYIERVSLFVRNTSFSNLISAIYAAYPEMKKNSIFSR